MCSSSCAEFFVYNHVLDSVAETYVISGFVGLQLWMIACPYFFLFSFYLFQFDEIVLKTGNFDKVSAKIENCAMCK